MQIVWFKRDLRVDDHEALFTAAQSGPVIPLYIIEPDLWRQPDMSSRHWEFVKDSLISLNHALTAIGQPLVIRVGPAEEVLKRLCHQYPICKINSHMETGNNWTYQRDRRVKQCLQALNVEWLEYRQQGVIRGHCNRDNWAAHWEAFMSASQYPVPTLESVDISSMDIPLYPAKDIIMANCADRQPGGRDIAEKTLNSFLKFRGKRYNFEISSPAKAASAGSRLSPHLAWGSLSMREVVQKTRETFKSTTDPQWKKALSAFESRLHWHCHFIQKLESEPRIEFENLHQATVNLRDTNCDQTRLLAWSEGKTGWPLVDACMRMLNQTGWINFRMRAMLMSVASYQLWLHWREPALHLARQFVDYEPGIHYPQIQMQSGTTGINTLRIYNPVKQSMQLDPHGHFIRKWLPELRHVSETWIHTPWQMSASLQDSFKVKIGSGYPAPLVDHEVAARQAKAKLSDSRKTSKARQESLSILNKHGSRSKQPRRLSRKPSNPLQGELF